MVRVSQKLNIQKQYQVLHLVNDYQGYSEVCTLYLSPEYRQHNNGAFLSKVRFLFMAQFQQRFTEKVIAEMRGYTDSNDVSPFWRSLGVHFFKIDFEEADYLTAKANKQFISDLMPRHPIYVSLLTKQAQEAIGKTHSKTRSALKILKRENFIFNQQIDIFDGGPVVEAQLSLIKTLRESKVYYLDGVVKTIDKGLKAAFDGVKAITNSLFGLFTNTHASNDTAQLTNTSDNTPQPNPSILSRLSGVAIGAINLS